MNTKIAKFFFLLTALLLATAMACSIEKTAEKVVSNTPAPANATKVKNSAQTLPAAPMETPSKLSKAPPPPAATASLQTPAALPPPKQPLKAWSVAKDTEEVFVLDAAARLYRLSAIDLLPLARSEPLFAAAPAVEQSSLLVGAKRIFVGSRALSQTLVLNRKTFSQTNALNKAGPMILDPGHKLFLIANQRIWAYNLADLTEPPRQLAIEPAYDPGLAYGAVPETLAIDPVARRLYAEFYNQYGSAPHNKNSYRAFDLDNLTQIMEFNVQPGHLSRPAVASKAGLIFSTLQANSGALSNRLIAYNSQGEKQIDKGPLDGLPLVAPSAEWLYLLRQRGLWTLRGPELRLQSIMPFTQTPPLDAALSSDGETLYLFGKNGLSAHSTKKLQQAGMPTLSPLPKNWLEPNPQTPGFNTTRVYTSPQADTLFVQLGVFQPYENSALETYRSEDGGKTWQFLTSVAYPQYVNLQYLSLSPNFNTDRTLTARTPQNILRSTNAGNTWQPWSPPLAFTGNQQGNRDIYLLEQNSNIPRALTSHPADDQTPAWSPAWTQIAFASNRNGNWDIFTLRADCACNLRQLTTASADDLLPAWSPDGRSIAFVSLRDGNPEIYLMDADGQNQRRLTFNVAGDWRPAWLPNSRSLAFTRSQGDNNNIYLLNIPPGAPDFEPEIAAIVASPADDRDPAINAENTLVFLSDRDGTMQAYTLDMKDSYARPFLLSSASQPAQHPAWVDEKNPAVLITRGSDAESDIYRLVYAAEDIPLTAAPGFNGHPAWGPVWWNPK